MQQLTRTDFIAAEPEYHGAVAACEGIDPYCCRTDWLLPFHAAFTPDSPLHIWRDGGHFLVLAQSRAGRQVFSPVDSMWGFASGLVGGGAARMLGRACCGDLRRGHVILYGLPDDRALLGAVARHTAATHRAFLLSPVIRCVASLSGGLDGFLSRRTRKFRASARRALRASERAGLQFRRVDRLAPERVGAFYEQVLAVEARSWKGLRGEGADTPPMREFYRRMLERIGPPGRLRAIMAERDGRPVGYIHGGCTAGRFRGLQFSFDECCRPLSLGNALQLNMLEWLCHDGFAAYDMGMCVPYKKNWTELEQSTMTLYLRPL